MASTVTLTGDLASLIGGNVQRVRAYLETNLPADQALVDTTRNLVMLGDQELTLAADGTFTAVGLVVTNATDLNVAANTLQYRVVAKYLDGTAGEKTWTSGWFFLTASADLADVAATAVPAAAVVTSDSVVANLVSSPTSATNDALEGLFVRRDSLPSAVATLDFPLIAAAGQQELAVTLTGAVVGDRVVLGPPATLAAGVIVTARVTAANTVTVRLSNITAAGIDPASASWTVGVLR